MTAAFNVWVQPGSSREKIVGRFGDVLKIAVAAPPEKGRANRAVEKLLARAFGVSQRDVKVASGATSRRKKVTIAGLRQDALDSWLAEYSKK